MKVNLSEFLACTDGPANQWIRERHMSVYVRKGRRYLEGQTMDCLDIGTVTVDERHRGKGHFTKFLLRFEQEASRLRRLVYVESILEPRLVPFLIKRGYKFVPNMKMVIPSMYKTV